VALPTWLNPVASTRWLWARCPGRWAPWLRVLTYVGLAIAIYYAWALILGTWLYGWWIILPVHWMRNHQVRKAYEAMR
jgi:hypothetical protein